MTVDEYNVSIEAQIKKHKKVAMIAAVGIVVSMVMLMCICFVTRKGDVTRNAPQIESVDKVDVPEESVMEQENKVIDFMSIPTILMFLVSLLLGHLELDTIQNLQKRQKLASKA